MFRARTLVRRLWSGRTAVPVAALVAFVVAGCGGSGSTAQAARTTSSSHGPTTAAPVATPSPTAGRSGTAHAAPITTPGYYLSLGDSLAFGYNLAEYDAETRAGDYSAATFDHGYTDLVGAELRRTAPGLPVVNLGCPSETATSYLAGGCPTAAARLHVPHAGSQATAALAYLRAHPGPGLVTVALGSNDVINLLKGCPTASVGCIITAFTAELPRLRTQLTGIATAIHDAAPQATVVMLALYNPLAIKVPGSDLIAGQVNNVVAAIAEAVPGVREADPFPVFNPATGESAAVCRFTLICSTPIDIHPTPAGYAELAALIEQAIGR